MLCFGFSQVVVGWMGHSMSHSRDPLLQKVGRVFASLLGGFCLEWWAPKHNMHHMFTNSQLYDEDIKHDYKVYLYPFLYLKWRFDSLVTAISTKNVVTSFLFLVGHHHDFIELRSPSLLQKQSPLLPSGRIGGWIFLSKHIDRKPRTGKKISIENIIIRECV